MIFKDFNNIEIMNDLGVSPVGKDTLLLARYASKLESKHILDIGTGTGLIPIYLNTCGFDCDGIDINPNAVSCAKKNALRNNIKINFWVSDLFDNMEKKYDLIIFNPPFGNVDSSFLSKYLEIIKSILPKENKLVANLSFQFIKKQRANLIKKFVTNSKNFLTQNGKILIFLHNSELILLKGTKFSINDAYGNMKLALVQF